MQTSPLGKYAQAVAAVVAIAIIFVDLALHALQAPPDGFVDNLAFAAFGAVFGATGATIVDRTVLQRDVAAIHTRLDSAGIPTTNGNGDHTG